MKPVVSVTRDATPAMGRKADMFAAILAAFATLLSIVATLIFFAGFVANDSYFGAVIAAFVFSFGLGLFAIGPAFLTARYAWRSYRHGGQKRDYAWVMFLSLPWIVLSALCWLYTPIPIWISAIGFVSALLLCLWAIISWILD